MRHGDDGKVDELGRAKDEDGFAPARQVGVGYLFLDLRGGFALEDAVGRPEDADDERAPDADVEGDLGEDGGCLRG
jgi:hypothetical protein